MEKVSCTEIPSEKFLRALRVRKRIPYKVYPILTPSHKASFICRMQDSDYLKLVFHLKKVFNTNLIQFDLGVNSHSEMEEKQAQLLSTHKHLQTANVKTSTYKVPFEEEMLPDQLNLPVIKEVKQHTVFHRPFPTHNSHCYALLTRWHSCRG